MSELALDLTVVLQVYENFAKDFFHKVMPPRAKKKSSELELEESLTSELEEKEAHSFSKFILLLQA